jgi:hypothetical protein
MKLEDQVCSIEYAKILKKLGVPQTSLFSWQVGHAGIAVINLAFMGEINSDDYSSFTVSELCEMLPLRWEIYIRDKDDFV